MYSAVDMAVFYASGHHRGPVKPIAEDIVTLQPEEKHVLQEDPEKGNVFFMEVCVAPPSGAAPGKEYTGEVLEKYGRPDPFMPLVCVHRGEYAKTLKEMGFGDQWFIQGTAWGDAGALRNFTPDVIECKVYESAESEGVAVRVLPWQGFNSWCQAAKIEVMDHPWLCIHAPSDGSSVVETWESHGAPADGNGFVKKCAVEDEGAVEDQQAVEGSISRLEPQDAASYNLHWLSAGPYKLILRGDKDSVEGERDVAQEKSVEFSEDEFNWFGGMMDSIYDNLASPGTTITVEVSCSAGKDVYEIKLQDKKFAVWSLAMKAAGMTLKS
jgi:hypothetical protein